MSVMGALASPFSPIGRWIGRRMWWVEHAFERARTSDKAVDDTRLRIFFVLVLFAAGFVTLSLGATRAALFSPYGRAGEPLAPLPGARADLIDRNGLVLAMDLPRYGLYLDPGEIYRKSDVRAALLAALPAIVPAKLDKTLAGDRREFIGGALPPDVMGRVHDLGLPGVTFEDENGRAYPLGTMAAHLIGFTSKDGIGLSGAEKAFDPRARAAVKSPVALSIDLRVQGALEDELARAHDDYKFDNAAGIVVNVRTGEILAMSSWPSFDPAMAAELAKSDPGILVNHAAETVYEPGSVMKVFTLAAGLDSGVATTDTMFDVATPLVLPGQTIHDYEKGEAALPLWKVFTHSSNIGAARLGLRIGAERFSQYFHAYGLFAAAPGELKESARPITPARMSDNIVASMSFGHAISVSPLAIATGMSAILNGGTYRPLTLRRVDGAPAPGRVILKASTSQTMLDLMRRNAVEGTGMKANVPGLRVGGKTGTATKLVKGHYVEGKNALNLASFAAIFPTDGAVGADRYLVLIMLDQPKPTQADGGVTTGALTAAPTAGRVIERIAPFVGVRRVIIASDLSPKAVDASALGADH
jgi:cell division protein FtsI (penicillin-binding protein 3)